MNIEPDAFDQLVAALVRGEEVGAARVDEVVVDRGLTMAEVQQACDKLDAALPRLAGLLRRGNGILTA